MHLTKAVEYDNAYGIRLCVGLRLLSVGQWTVMMLTVWSRRRNVDRWSRNILWAEKEVVANLEGVEFHLNGLRNLVLYFLQSLQLLGTFSFGTPHARLFSVMSCLWWFFRIIFAGTRLVAKHLTIRIIAVTFTKSPPKCMLHSVLRFRWTFYLCIK